MASASDQFSQSTTWVRRFETPLREFLRTETGGAAVILTAVVAALVCVNVDASSYEELWRTERAGEQRTANVGDDSGAGQTIAGLS